MCECSAVARSRRLTVSITPIEVRKATLKDWNMFFIGLNLEGNMHNRPKWSQCREDRYIIIVPAVIILNLYQLKDILESKRTGLGSWIRSIRDAGVFINF